MLMKPEKIRFEDDMDLIDYVGRGFPPTKANYEKVIAAMHETADPNVEVPAVKGEVYVPYDMNRKLSDDELEAVLNRIYQNNCKNRNRFLIGAGITIGLIVSIAFAGGKKDEEEENDNDRYK